MKAYHLIYFTLLGAVVGAILALLALSPLLERFAWIGRGVG